MKSRAYFEKINKHIERYLNDAEVSIDIAMAWFTDPKLFKIICAKAKEGLKVEVLLANNEINHNSMINYDDLIDVGGIYNWIGKDGYFAPLMHNKFCIIDSKVLIFGSYNWTHKAKSNHESITVIEEDFELINDFILEFKKIKNKYHPIRRGEEDIKSKNYTIQIFSDYEISTLKIEVRGLEYQIVSLENEKIEIERLIHKYENKFNLELGEIINQILKFKKKLAKEAFVKNRTNSQNEKLFNEAEKDFEEFSFEYNNFLKKPNSFQLTENELKEIKTLFRKATKLCHPDKVSETCKEQASTIFNELKKAYDRNDLDRVTELLNDLEKGFLQTSEYNGFEKNQLIRKKENLLFKRSQLEENIKHLRNHPVYLKILDIKDWEHHFHLQKKKYFEILMQIKSRYEKTLQG